MSPPPPGFAARAQAAYATGGDKLLIWGGANAEGVALDTGAIYDTTLDTWQVMTVTANTPSARVLAGAAWTGSRFMIVGGRSSSGSAEYKDGALYDPVTQVWTSTRDAGKARSGALMLGLSGQVLAWGGWSRSGAVLENADRYSVPANNWSTPTNNLLAKREHVGWSVSGASLYVIGGRDDNGTALSNAFVYQMATNTWTALPSLPGPRYGSFAVHDGAGLWLWGGRDGASAATDGLVLEGSSWAAISNDGAPSARWAPHRQSGWSCKLTDGRSAIVGGHDIAGNPERDGGVYDSAEDAWLPIPEAGGAHEWGVGVCIDGAILLWGGATEGTVTATGERWSLDD